MRRGLRPQTAAPARHSAPTGAETKPRTRGTRQSPSKTRARRPLRGASRLFSAETARRTRPPAPAAAARARRGRRTHTGRRPARGRRKRGRALSPVIQKTGELQAARPFSGNYSSVLGASSAGAASAGASGASGASSAFGASSATTISKSSSVGASSASAGSSSVRREAM